MYEIRPRILSGMIARRQRQFFHASTSHEKPQTEEQKDYRYRAKGKEVEYVGNHSQKQKRKSEENERSKGEKTERYHAGVRS